MNENVIYITVRRVPRLSLAIHLSEGKLFAHPREEEFDVELRYDGQTYALAGMPTRYMAEEVGRSTLYALSKVGHNRYNQCVEGAPGCSMADLPVVPADVRYSIDIKFDMGTPVTA